MDITPEQIRAARALLRLEQADIAQRADVSVVSIRRLENAGSLTRVSPAILESVRRVLEQAGAEFIVDGVRKRPSVRPDARARYLRLREISLRSAEELKGRVLLTDDDLYDEIGVPT